MPDWTQRNPPVPAKLIPVEEIEAAEPLILDGSARAELEVDAKRNTGTGSVVWIHADGSATEVRVDITAIAAHQQVRFGAGVYLTIEGLPDRDALPTDAPIARALELKDGTVCLYLPPAAKDQLFEQLERHRFIVSMHEAIAQRRMREAVIDVKAMAEQARSNVPAARRRIIFKGRS